MTSLKWIMDNIKIRDFLKSLSNELDSLVNKIGVFKIVMVVVSIFTLKYIIATYFDDYSYTFYIILILIIGLSITSLADNSKIKSLAVWLISIVALITIVVMFFVLVFGIGESVVKSINNWFN